MSARVGDGAFRWGSLICAACAPALIALLGYRLISESLPGIQRFGWGLFTTSVWDPVHERFGILFAVWGTVVTSALALALAAPIGLGAAVFLAELAPRWLRQPVGFLVELLAAIPSIVYGIWGVFVLCPALRPMEEWLGARLGGVPLFSGAPLGVGVLAAGLVLAIMVLPYITAVSREVIEAVPVTQRQAAYALGATRWETIRGPVMRYARSGILGAVMLALGRAVGETMAVTMVIGNRTEISASLFSPAYTLASLIANEFAEATQPLHISALVAAGLALLGVTVVINAGARLLIWRATRASSGVVRE